MCIETPQHGLPSLGLFCLFCFMFWAPTDLRPFENVTSIEFCFVFKRSHRLCPCFSALRHVHVMRTHIGFYVAVVCFTTIPCPIVLEALLLYHNNIVHVHELSSLETCTRYENPFSILCYVRFMLYEDDVLDDK